MTHAGVWHHFETQVARKSTGFFVGQITIVHRSTGESWTSGEVLLKAQTWSGARAEVHDQAASLVRVLYGEE